MVAVSPIIANEFILIDNQGFDAEHLKPCCARETPLASTCNMNTTQGIQPLAQGSVYIVDGGDAPIIKTVGPSSSHSCSVSLVSFQLLRPLDSPWATPFGLRGPSISSHPVRLSNVVYSVKAFHIPSLSSLTSFATPLPDPASVEIVRTSCSPLRSP